MRLGRKLACGEGSSKSDETAWDLHGRELEDQRQDVGALSARGHGMKLTGEAGIPGGTQQGFPAGVGEDGRNLATLSRERGRGRSTALSHSSTQPDLGWVKLQEREQRRRQWWRRLSGKEGRDG